MELRKDYILDKYVIISESRGKRPHQFASVESKDVGTCFFCPGNESYTPNEIIRTNDSNGNWKMRVFPNKFAAVDKVCDGNCKPFIQTDNQFYTYASAYGSHEILVETPEHEKQLWDLSEEEITAVFKVYKERIRELMKDELIKFVAVFKNSGKEAGTSIVHTHSQIIAINFVPPFVSEKLSAITHYNYCPYCKIMQTEKDSYRRCFENERWIAFTPYASKFHYEIWVLPKKHISTMEEFDDKDFTELSKIMKLVLTKLKSINAPYNYYLHYYPRKDFHFMIEVTPRLATWAGFEEDTGIIINSVSPELAAKFYRGEE